MCEDFLRQRQLQVRIYRAECTLCERENKRKKTTNTNEKLKTDVYIGETNRCLHERVSKHLELTKTGDESSFILKHWAYKLKCT